MPTKTLKVMGRIFIEYKLRALTAIHVGGSAVGITIAGLDNPVIRDPVSNRPYIPGTSLKGKIRSLLEKQYGLPPTKEIARTRIHVCEKEGDYKKCPVCHVFGVPAELDYENIPACLLVRDLHLSEESAKALDGLPLDRPYTEIKTEVSIDRITSQANPRSVERVPAGAVFGPGEFVYTIYAVTDSNGSLLVDPRQDVERLGVLFEGMSLLEHDYLGGMGSRGYGKVRFENIRVSLRTGTDYFTQAIPIVEVSTAAELLAKKSEILTTIQARLGL